MSSAEENGAPPTKWKTVEQVPAEIVPDKPEPPEPVRLKGHCRLKVKIEWVDEETGEVIAECDEDRRLSHLFKDNHLVNAEPRILDVWKDIKNPLHTELMDYIEKLKPEKPALQEDDMLGVPGPPMALIDIPGN